MIDGKLSYKGNYVADKSKNGSDKRKLSSWIDSFLEFTDNLETSPTYRLWAAISAIAATMERKTWLFENDPLYPNLYVLLVGGAGTGKTRSIRAARNFVRCLPEPLLAPTSMTMASMADILNDSKRIIVRHPEAPLEYNTLYIAINELSAFMHDYKHAGELVAGLTDIYDCDHYGQARRGGDLRISIENPQLNIIAGSTPARLINLIPEYAWEDGFTSRIIMIYADDKPSIDIFHSAIKLMPNDMIHDLKIINSIIGEFTWTEEWTEAMNAWKELKFKPVPSHPKLEHYCTRRFTHLMKLSMISSIDRSNDLVLTKDDFNRAMLWLLRAEERMPLIFSGGQGGTDSKAIDEIEHFIRMAGPDGVNEQSVLNYARKHIMFATNVTKVLALMEQSGLIKMTKLDKRTGLRHFIANQQAIGG